MSDERIEADLEKLDAALARWKAWVLARDGWPMSDAERGLLEAMGEPARPPDESTVRRAPLRFGDDEGRKSPMWMPPHAKRKGGKGFEKP